MDIPTQLSTSLAGRYLIEREIGRGGMATVYLARDLRHDRLVALKVLNPELGAVLGVDRFLSEIKVTANLQHPNLLPLFDSGEADGLLFYVMPFVDGESLRARLDREKQLPVDDAVRLTVAICGALVTAHEQGVVHRDLKPENVLLQHGQPVIADFGIALAVSNAGGNRITQTGLSLGTPQYMSPEQATGDRMIDGRSDIYSLAAMLYEMLTGDPPHVGSTAQAVIAQLLTEEPRSIQLARPSVPDYIAAAVSRALEKLPADRFATASQFGDALEGKASPRTPLKHRATHSWRTRVTDPVVLALVGVALVAVAFSVRERRARAGIPAATPVRFLLPMPANVRINGQNAGSSITISPDGETIAFVGMTASGTQQLYLRPLSDLTAHPVPGTDGAYYPFFSPDGRWVAFWAKGKIQKVPVSGGVAQPIADVTSLLGAAWTRSDVIVLSVGVGIATVPASGGALRRVPHDSSVREVAQLFPYALPDGDHVLYASGSGASASSVKIAVLSLSSGKSTVLDLPGTMPLGVADGVLVYGGVGNSLLAIPFDVSARRITGAPVTVVSDVRAGLAGEVWAGMSTGGSLVYVTGSQNSQALLVDEHGTPHPLLAEARPYGTPRYSPDGKRIAFGISAAPRTDIWIYDIAPRTLTRFTNAGLVNERPEWTPDGKRLLYRTDRGSHSAIWWQSIDQSAPAEPLMASDKVEFWEAVFSPDAKYIAYQVDSTGADLYYRATTGDSTPKPIATTPFSEDKMRVSPDGKWIAFTTDESGQRQVVVQPFPGPGGRVQVSAAGGDEPVWSPVGQRLIYRDGLHFVAAAYTTAPTFAIKSRTVLFDDVYIRSISPHANYDISPDGTQFLVLKPEEDPRVVVVHDWMAEVRARMAARP